MLLHFWAPEPECLFKSLFLTCSWPGFLMASPLSPTTDTGARSERAASWGSGKDPFSRASLHWED